MSEKMYTEKEYLEGIRGATGERAVWFYLLMKEAEKLGVNPDDICKEAIYGFGKMRGQKYSVADTPGKMAEMLYNSKGQKVFEMELVENTDENGVLKFHHCPLDAAWKEYGLTKEERKEICRLACYGDYGRVDCAQSVRLEFAQKRARSGRKQR